MVRVVNAAIAQFAVLSVSSQVHIALAAESVPRGICLSLLNWLSKWPRLCIVDLFRYSWITQQSAQKCKQSNDNKRES